MIVLPNELIIYTLQFLDAKTIFQLSYTSRLCHAISVDALKWIKQCFTDPLCQPLISAANLQSDLINKHIDAKFLHDCIHANDIKTIKSILYTNNARKFTVYAPFYEHSIPKFFPRAGSATRMVYLTEEMAKINTTNRAKVKNWLKVSLTLTQDEFETLYRDKKLASKQAASQLPIITDTYNKQPNLHHGLLAGQLII